MKLRLKLALLSMASGAIAFQFSGCMRFLGDVAGDIFFLQAVD